MVLASSGFGIIRLGVSPHLKDLQSLVRCLPVVEIGWVSPAGACLLDRSRADSYDTILAASWNLLGIRLDYGLSWIATRA